MSKTGKEVPENQRNPEERVTIGGTLLNLDSFVDIDLVDKETGQKVELSLFEIESGTEIENDLGELVKLNSTLLAELQLAVTYRLPGGSRGKKESANRRTIGVRLTAKNDKQKIVSVLEGVLTIAAKDDGTKRNYDIDLTKSLKSKG